MIPSLVTVIRALPGGAQSRLVLCDDGNLYVLKTHPNPQGPNVLANEAMGSILLRGLGLPSPPWKPVRIDLKSVRLFPELITMHTAAKQHYPACGLHFGSQYLGGPDCSVFDFVPPSRLDAATTSSQSLGIHLFDIWANHQDERQCVFQKIPEQRTYAMRFIDNGHLFGGPRWSDAERCLRPSKSKMCKPITTDEPEVEYWLDIFQTRIPTLLSQAIATIPKDWYIGDIQSLYMRLMERLVSIRFLIQEENCRSKRPRQEV